MAYSAALSSPLFLLESFKGILTPAVVEVNAGVGAISLCTTVALPTPTVRPKSV